MKSRVLIAGGGVASIETALALRDLAGDRVEVTIFSPRRDFVYRPYAVGEPYGTARVAHYDLAELASRCGAGFRQDSIASVDSEMRLVTTHDGEKFPYDYLVVAPGAQLLWPVPGAITFWGIADEQDVRKVMSGLRSGELHSLAFTMPSGESWALPLYELALLAESELSGAGIDAKLTVVTPEDSPLEIFGHRAGELVGELLHERGIEVCTGRHPVRFENGRLITVPGDPFDVDAVVSLPKLEGRRIRGIPHDPEGFVQVDDHCRMLQRDRIFAAGDVTNFPVKQGGIATQQADVIAEAIAAELGVEIEPQAFDPILRGVLWTGEGPRYLQGWLGGGHGETSSLTAQPPWQASEGKIVGRYLTDFIAEVESSKAAAPVTPSPGASRARPFAGFAGH
ncbi:MAG TPA: FAD-dependent oxidoreductase [Solirubrobacterales bacterium]|nr:FAD-dependent oxidoreductase [Solirubrobacterales bacterium]